MDFSDFKNFIFNQFKSVIGIELSESQCQIFYDYMNLLIEKNKVMNLTAIIEPKEIVVRHFVDSSILLKIFGPDYFRNKSVIDIGTGAGFPGLPLAIMLPDTKFVLNDTLGKRINFLQEVLDCISLNNVNLVKARAEDLFQDKSYREQFDFAVSRAVANISTLSEYSLPAVKVDGKVFFYKMDDCDSELKDGEKAIKTLGGMFHVKHSYHLIDGDPDRCVLEINKTGVTPHKYPRKASMPAKDPL